MKRIPQIKPTETPTISSERDAGPLVCSMTEWLTASEAAHYLRIKVRTLLLWARQGKIKGYPLSGTKRHVWRFRQHDLDGALLAPTAVLNCEPLSVRSTERRVE